VIGEPQNKAQATKAPKLTKEMGLIDWSRPAATVANQIRAMQPWPTAYTYLHRRLQSPLRVIVAKAVAANSVSTSQRRAPGSITNDAAATKLFVHCGDQTSLDVVELQPAGKRRMNAADFQRGNSLPTGSRFGPEIAPPGIPS